MKLALLGSKQKVKGFDIELHTKYKLGNMYKQADAETAENADASGEENEKAADKMQNQEVEPEEAKNEEVAD